MTFLLVLLTILLSLALLWLLCIGGRWHNPALRQLRQYHYAHRGLHDRENQIPENSLAAFRLAVQNGLGAELDVHLTKDGRLMVMHDENLRRTVGVDADLCDLTSTQLEQYALEGTHEPIPYLEEVLPMFESAHLPLIIELKPAHNDHSSLARETLKILENYPELLFCIESFDPLAMNTVRRLKPEIVRGQLSTDFMREPEQLHFPLTFLLKNLLLNFLSRPDFVAYNFKYRKNLSLRMCKWLYEVAEFDWTIHTKPQANQALREGSTLIFENPALLSLFTPGE